MKHTWSQPMLLRLQQLCAEPTLKPPFYRIAELINEEFGTQLTPHACIGMAFRITHGKRVLTTTVELRQITGRSVPVGAPIPAEIAPPAPGEQGLDIYQLRTDSCHWPLGGDHDYPPYRYCGDKALEGLPYCATHCNRAYTAPRMQWE